MLFIQTLSIQLRSSGVQNLTMNMLKIIKSYKARSIKTESRSTLMLTSQSKPSIRITLSFANGLSDTLISTTQENLMMQKVVAKIKIYSILWEEIKLLLPLANQQRRNHPQHLVQLLNQGQLKYQDLQTELRNSEVVIAKMLKLCRSK